MLDVEFLKKYAADAGLDAAKFNACMDTAKYGDRVQEQMGVGARLGVESTPTTFINGRLDRNLGGLLVDDIMTRTPKTVDPTMLTGEAMAILDENRISALVVVEDGKPIGVVHFHDLLRIGVA